jgi:protein-S-isoprenylcysteine O-methyltransferase Ste14
VISSFLALIVTLIGMGGLLFGAAGSFDWLTGWWFLGVFAVLSALSTAALLLINPDLVRRRMHPGADTPLVDRFVLGAICGLFCEVLIVAGLDAGRRHLVPGPTWWPGVVLMLAGWLTVLLSMRQNPFFEATIRHQSELGQTVVRNGLYGVVRHPGYAGGIAMMAGVVLALGSTWALIPCALFKAVVVIRLLLEEEFLNQHLDGYTGYCDEVRWRLLPKVW